MKYNVEISFGGAYNSLGTSSTLEDAKKALTVDWIETFDNTVLYTAEITD